MKFDIIRQFEDGTIALARIFLECFEHDGIQIAAQSAPQRDRSGRLARPLRLITKDEVLTAAPRICSGEAYSGVNALPAARVRALSSAAPSIDNLAMAKSSK
jgi:hypothetical protein